MFASSRPTAFRFNRLISAVGICSAALSVAAAPALAHGNQPQPPATCEDQTFAQEFGAYKDSNYYTLAPGGDFNSSSEGWELSKGAQIVEAARPYGAGGVLNMPSGSVAVSPPVCVTLQYPTARLWVRDVTGSEGVSVAVAYTNTKTAEAPKNVGQVHGQQSSWTLANSFNVQPQTAGHSEETREVRFVFTANGKTSDFQLYDFNVDPRMR